VHERPDPGVRVCHRPVDAARAGKGHRRGPERVVHQGVVHVALEDAGLQRPDLGHDVGLGVERLHAAPELAPEVVVLDLVRHVQSPAVDAEPDPVLRDTHEVLADLGVVHVQLRQGREVPPGLVAQLAVGPLTGPGEPG
jgi:hypothetical protein